MRNREELDGWAEKMVVGYPESTSEFLWVKGEVEASDLTEEEKQYVSSKANDLMSEIWDKRPPIVVPDEGVAGSDVAMVIGAIAFIVFLANLG